MAGNYVIVADFCDRAGPFLKVEKNSHSRQKIVCSVRFCPKTVGFRFENCHSTTPTTCQLHVAKNSFTLTTYVSPFKANSSANWNAVSRQIRHECHTSVRQWRLKPSASKTVSSVFHLHNTSATHELSVYLDGLRLRHECHPTYLGVTLDRTLSYREHLRKTAGKLKN